jgi:hypothetical protein
MKAILTLIVVMTVTAGPAFGQYRGGGGGGRASTAAQAYAYGLGNVIQSEGMYNLATAQAALAAEQARTLDIQNRQAAVKAYFEMKQMNAEYRAQARTPTQAAPQHPLNHYYDTMKPQKLPPTQLDPVTGQITWPQLLMNDEFKPVREQLDAMFVMWAHHRNYNFNDVRKSVEAFHAQLKDHIDEYPPQDFENAYKFLDTLEYQAHFPAS